MSQVSPDTAAPPVDQTPAPTPELRIAFDRTADGTVRATCAGMVGTGQSESQALRMLHRQVQTAREAGGWLP